MNKLTRISVYTAFALIALVSVFLCLMSEVHARNWILLENWSISIDRVCRDGADVGYRYDYYGDYHTLDYDVYLLPDGVVIGGGTMTATIPVDPPKWGGVWLYNFEQIDWSQNLNSGDRVLFHTDSGSRNHIVADVQDCIISEPNEFLVQLPQTTNGSVGVQGAVTSTLLYTNSLLFWEYKASDLIIDDVNIRLQAEHEYDNEIRIHLTSPSGTKITLITEVGNPGSDFGDFSFSLFPDMGLDRDCEYAVDGQGGQPLTFDDDSIYSLLDPFFYPPYSRVNFTPEGPDYLSIFNGERAVGGWILEIIDDDWHPDTSKLICWTLDIWGVPIYDTFLPIINKAPIQAPDLTVEGISITNGDLNLVLKNQGPQAVVNEFWVDLYVNPTNAPTQVNQIWQNLSDYGAVWGVEGDALPLLPGETMVLTLGDSYYWSSLSHLPSLLLPGANIYAQVDSANVHTTYGAVLEGHEIIDDPYNNISSIVITTPVTLNTPALLFVQTKSANLLPDRVNDE